MANQLSKKQVFDISQELQCGMKVFVNIDTLEYKSVLDMDDMDDFGFWDEVLEEIENNWKRFFTIEKMSSREGFQIMENFVDELEDGYFRDNLIKILNRKSPFANFKAEVESSEFREQWFAFRDAAYVEYVQEELEMNDVAFEK
ncbi:UPF0158 family protein [Aquiflexum lacus]|uniref:UPF0158 family protein n=1 Tax=Aquiflexum lacus TaxID=2483805 RepID=UPI0018946BDC|nr:UPF0158 family protein [Aquiflexum lacus]